jgi:E3 ubiquitin-protein ligase AIP2
MQAAIEALHKQLGSKKTFVDAIDGLHAICADPSFYDAAPSFHDQMSAAVLRGGTLVQSRYTSKMYWVPALRLFESAWSVLSEHPSAAKVAELSDLARAEVGEAVVAHQQTAGAASPWPPVSMAAQAGSPSTQELLMQVLSDPSETLAEDQMQRLMASLVSSGVIEVEDTESGPPPASREAIRNLLMETVNTGKRGAKEPEVCSVCQEEFPPHGKAQKMPCGHFFHVDCLVEWLEKHNTCPLCRHQLPSEKMHFDADADRVASNNPQNTTGMFS